jgi:U3 small nucleolar RNA-associated protein 16
MLSKLLKSARSFLIDTPQIETTIPLSDTFEEETMVTTRRKQIETPLDDDLSEYNPIHVDVPTSSEKRGRCAKPEDTLEMSPEEESLPPSTKRRKTLPLREREAESPEGDLEDIKGVKTHPVVEIPARKATPPKGQIGGVISVGSPAKREEQQDFSSKKTHKRFESEDIDEEFFSTARESNEGDLVDAPIVLSDEESGESDDDAPEAIGIQEAAQTIKSKDRDAAKVVKEQVNPFSSSLPFLYTDCSQGN